MDGGDGCITMSVYLIGLNCIFKNDCSGLCVFYYN